jgi:hypothetical protein
LDRVVVQLALVSKAPQITAGSLLEDATVGATEVNAAEEAALEGPAVTLGSTPVAVVAVVAVVAGESVVVTVTPAGSARHTRLKLPVPKGRKPAGHSK